MDRIRKLKDLPYSIIEWSSDELEYYNDEVISIDDKYFNKFTKAMNYNEGIDDYSLDDIFLFEDKDRNLIVLVGGRSDMNSFQDMLDRENVNYETYPFERYL